MLGVVAAEGEVRLGSDTRGGVERSGLLQYFLGFFDLAIDGEGDWGLFLWLEAGDEVDVGHSATEGGDGAGLLAAGQ